MHLLGIDSETLTATEFYDKCDLFNSHFHNSCFDETAFKKTNVADSDIDLDNIISEDAWKNPDVGIVM